MINTKTLTRLSSVLAELNNVVLELINQQDAISVPDRLRQAGFKSGAIITIAESSFEESARQVKNFASLPNEVQVGFAFEVEVKSRLGADSVLDRRPYDYDFGNGKLEIKSGKSRPQEYFTISYDEHLHASQWSKSPYFILDGEQIDLNQVRVRGLYEFTDIAQLVRMSVNRGSGYWWRNEVRAFNLI